MARWRSLLLVVLALFTFAAHAMADTTPPVLAALTVMPSPVDVTASAAEARIDYVATDDDSGLVSFEILFAPAQQECGVGAYESFAGTPSRNGSVAFTLAQYSSQPGEWPVCLLRLVDAAGNERYYTRDELVSHGWLGEIEVLAVRDTSAPRLTALSFRDTEIDATGGPADLTVDYSVSSDLAGVRSFLILFAPPGRTCSSGDFETFPPARNRDGSLTLSIGGPGAPPGVWRLCLLQLQDEAGNSETYDALQLDGLGFPTEITVAAPPVSGPIPANVFPLQERFEAGNTAALGAEWELATTNTGRARVTGAQRPLDNYHLELTQTGGGPATNEANAILHLDLLEGSTPLSGVTLDFRVKATGGYYNQSGSVEACQDPTNCRTILPLYNLPATYTHYSIDLDAEVARLGLAYTDDFQIRFLHNGSYSGNSFYFDNVRVLTGATDIFGPRVLGQIPNALVTAPVDHVDISFDEIIGSFPASAVKVVAGNGTAVPVTSVTSMDGATWTVSFTAQQQPGIYTITVGPGGVADTAGNLLNQDQDVINGNDSYVGTFAIGSCASAPPITEDFEAAAIGALACHWSLEQGGDGRMQVTGAGSPRQSYHLEMTNDYGGSSAAVLHLDLLDGVDPIRHVTVDFWAKQLTYNYSSLRLDMRAGAGEPWTLVQYLYTTLGSYAQFVVDLDAAIAANGLSPSDDFQLRFYHDGYYGNRPGYYDDIRVRVGADAFGPQVVEQTPAGLTDGPLEVEVVEVRFDEDVVFPQGGAVLTNALGQPVAVSVEPGTDASRWRLRFAAQQQPGTYTLRINAAVVDLAGNALNQDKDALNGDTYTGSFTIRSAACTAPFYENLESVSISDLSSCWSFESGGDGQVRITSGSGPRQSYHLEMTNTYSGSSAAILHLDLLDAAEPVRNVTLDLWAKYFTSSYNSARLDIRSGEGQPWSFVQYLQPPFGTYAQYVFDLDAAITTAALSYSDDFQIRVLHEAYYGSRPFFFDDIRLQLGADVFGPKVVEQSPSGLVDQAVDVVDLHFDEPVVFPHDGATLTNALGQPLAFAVEPGIDASHWRLRFTAQAQAGTYTLLVKPAVIDLAGNALNQDKDSLNGDTYTGNFTIRAAACSLPFAEDFETVGISNLRSCWSFDNSGDGKVRLTGANGPRQSRHLEMANDYSGSSAAVLHIDLLDGVEPIRDVTLDLWAKYFTSSYNSARLEIRSGEGQPWAFVQYFQPPIGTYSQFVFDLDAAIDSAGLSYSDDFQIRIQHEAYYGSRPFYFDDVRVRLGADAFGPQVLEQQPTGLVDGPVDTVNLRFDEAVMFPQDGATLTNPFGLAVPVTVEPGIDATRWQVRFAAQPQPGTYTLRINPAVTDLAGNALNQDKDALNGDTYTESFTLRAAACGLPFQEDFESGDISALSPCWSFENSGDGQSRVSADVGPRQSYHLEMSNDYGGTSAAILHLDLLDGTAPIRDVTLDVWAKYFTANYNSARLEMRSDQSQPWAVVQYFQPPFGLYAQFVFDLDTAIDAAGLSYSDDFQIRFQHEAYYGSRPFFFDDVRARIGADVFGPSVLEQWPAGLGDGPVDVVDLHFDEPVVFPQDGATLTNALGQAVAVSVEPGADATHWRVRFAAQAQPGTYALRVNPAVTDLAGNALNHDKDALNGDTYTGSFTLRAAACGLPFLEDFESGDISAVSACWSFENSGDGQSRVSADVGPRQSYHLEMSNDYGGTSAAILHLDLLDGVEPIRDVTLDVWAKYFTSNYNSARLEIRSSEGQPWALVQYLQPPLATYAQLVFDLDTAIQTAGLSYSDDFQIRFQHDAYYGSRPFYFDDIRARVGADAFGPKVLDQLPAGLVDGPLAVVELRFDEAVVFSQDGATLTNALGQSVAVSIEPGDDATRWRVRFDAQAQPGAYTLRVNPVVTDLAGNALNQDKDANNGDTYTGSFTLRATACGFPFQEDFEDGNITGLRSCWSFESSGDGQSGVSAVAEPRQSYHLELTNDYIGSSAAILHLDLLDGIEPVRNVTLDVWAKYFTSNYNSARLEVRSGEGQAWVLVQYFQPPLAAYTNFVFDLDAVIAAAGLSYGDDFQIRFQHEAYYGIRPFYFDDVRVRIGADAFGPKVVELLPAGVIDGPLDTVDIRFDEAVVFPQDGATLINGLGETVAVTVEPGSDATRWRVRFTAQGQPGVYTLRVNAAVTDTVGNALNQDKDATNGDTFTGTFILRASACALPFLEGFENGNAADLSPCWSFENAGDGQTRVSSDSEPRQAFHLEMTNDYGGSSAAILHLDLLDGIVPIRDVTLGLWGKYFTPSYNSARLDIRSGEGQPWALVQYFQPPYGTYALFVVDLDAAIDAAGLAYSDDVQLRFQHDAYYGNRPFYFDDIQVRVGPLVEPTPSHTPTNTATATASPTATATATPTPTVPPVDVDLGRGAGRPGGIACVPATLRSNGSAVTAAGTAMSFAAPLGHLSCAINPQIGPGTFANMHVTCDDPTANAVNAIVQPSGASLAPDGLLYTNTFLIAADAALGCYAVANSPAAWSQDGVLPATGSPGQICVTSCTGDCDASGSCSVAEIQRVVNHFLGHALCRADKPALSCPVADSNLDGGISVGEIQQTVNCFLHGSCGSSPPS